MTTGYRGGATTPEVRLAALERRVSTLEAELEERQRKAFDRRMMQQFVGYSLLTGIGVSLLVYVVERAF